jgi:hypothetical protein
MRSGKEAYSEKYRQALALHRQGKPVAEIAKELGVSYSAAYHWVKGLREAPQATKLEEFEAYLKTRGPLPAVDIKEVFPKHNELYHTAAGRGGAIRRFVLSNPRTFGEAATWYYLQGQESLLKERITKFLAAFKDVDIKALAEEVKKAF